MTRYDVRLKESANSRSKPYVNQDMFPFESSCEKFAWYRLMLGAGIQNMHRDNTCARRVPENQNSSSDVLLLWTALGLDV